MSRSKVKSVVPSPPLSVGSLFLDSGAHSLWQSKVGNRRNRKGYDFFTSKEFWAYVDDYAAFVKANLDVVDYYANVDVIFHPEHSWRVLKYLESHHDLKPVPVIHWGCDLVWLKKHLDAGYDFIGMGGLGQGITKGMYLDWADRVFTYLCPGPTNLPKIRVHGFAMTAYDLMLRYPWWSVDSATWTKVGAYGSILVPHKRNDGFTFSERPYMIAVSKDAAIAGKGRSYRTLTPKQKDIVHEWLALIGIPLGKASVEGESLEEGVITHHSSRKAANLIFFEHMRKSLPEWPWPFLAGKHVQRGRFAL